METLLAITLFGATLWFWLSILAFIVICFIAEVKEDGYVSFIFLIVFGIVWYFWGDLKPLRSLFTISNILIYFGIGLGFAFVRSFFSARALGERIKDLPKTRDDIKGPSHVYQSQDSEKERFLDKLKENVFRWWFQWPISLFTWIATDIATDIANFLYSRVENIFKFIVDLGIKSVK